MLRWSKGASVVFNHRDIITIINMSIKQCNVFRTPNVFFKLSTSQVRCFQSAPALQTRFTNEALCAWESEQDRAFSLPFLLRPRHYKHPFFKCQGPPPKLELYKCHDTDLETTLCGTVPIRREKGVGHTTIWTFRI